MGRAKKVYTLSREEIIEILKAELEKETNAMLDKMDNVDNAYDFEKVAVNGFSSFNQKWLQALAGIEPDNKNLKKKS